MQIVPFLTHYQFVYVNIDIPSFSVISYLAKSPKLVGKMGDFGRHFVLNRNKHDNISHNNAKLSEN